jgi:peroxiredoxin
MTPDVGNPVPSFTLPDSDGTPRSLEALVAANALVLIFFRGHW